ncbi:MAG TPA: hypothetical protein VK781_06240 [Solirubrobacteraceae bacterium]|jgi:hypothetical protein|nr:hypothetical protein [Solirubrobacteraceae bacterium]
MISVRSVWPRIAGAATVGLLGALALSPANAAAAQSAPAWGAFPVVGPTNLYATTGARNEVQTVSVVAGGEGKFNLSFEGSTTGEMTCGEPAAAVRSELESLPSVGAGNVQVTASENPSGSLCSQYSVTFLGKLSDKPLPIMTGTSNTTTVIETAGRGGWGKLALYLVDEGGARTSGTVTVTVTLPNGITTYETPEGVASVIQAEGPGFRNEGWTCSKGAGLTVVTCTDEQPAYPGLGPGSPELGKADLVPIDIPLHVENTTPGEVMSEITVSGGSAPPVTVHQPIKISPTPASPGVQMLKARTYEADGSPAVQAGAHPFAITTGFFVNTTLDHLGHVVPVDEVKNVEANLPPGLIGNPQAVPKCESHGSVTQCATSHQETQVGVTATMVGSSGTEGFGNPGNPSGLWNLVPEAAVPAEFGFVVVLVPLQLRAKVRSDGDYGVTVSSVDTLQTEKVFGSIVTFWGKPNESVHDEERCTFLFFGIIEFGCGGTKVPNTPFLTDPTDCVQQAQAAPSMTMELSFWQEPEAFSAPLSSGLAPVSGCGRVPFHPALHVVPTQHSAATPVGLDTELHMPQVDSELGVAEADVRKAVVTLPEGMSISPAAAGGLSACSESQIGLTGSHPVSFDLATPSCPESSKLGTVRIDSPLLPDPLNGSIYLAEQDNNPFGSLLAVYLYATDPVSGVEIKVAGRIDPDPLTGRITATFDDLPQLAFGNVKLSFKSGPRAPIMTPSSCGTFAATSDLTPTSVAGAGPEGEAVAGGSDALSTDAVVIEGCKPTGFAPSFVAGASNNQAGALSPFTLTLSRNSDEETTPRTVSVTMPPGLSGMLSNVPLCGEPQAREGSCDSASQIGHVTVVFGDGPNPLTLPEAGKGQDPVFLTGPYEGAPFGLSIVVPAEAGPFNLGKVVVRAKILVDPHTAQITVASDPMPTILQGIPTDLKVVNVAIDRDQFTLNPTNCQAMSITGQIGSSQGVLANVSNRFQAANCRDLGFKPSFKVSVTGKTSRANGAGLTAKLSYPKNAGQANIAKVKVSLPKQLPSRLTTLQKACPAVTFQTNPAGCPVASRIGTARTITPILPVALTGPVYFVSHGGQAFPDLVVVLQGYGVTVDLTGTTFISKAGITSTTFEQVPDVPVNSFELKLPQGKNSVLAANGNLCAAKLAMPTIFIGQNGAEIHTNTPIATTGCPKHVRHVRNRSTRKKAKTQSKRHGADRQKQH